MRKVIYVIGLPLMLFSLSCTKSIPDYGNTATVGLANGWWAVLYDDAGNALTNPAFFVTHNTAGNTDSIWVDDLKHGYQFKCKAKVDNANLTFAVTNSTNEYYTLSPAGGFAPTVNITGGKVLPKAGHSLAGNITDSIYMKAVFSDDPTTTYIIAGTARTGFIEDDY